MCGWLTYFQGAGSSESPPSQTNYKNQLLCSTGEKRMGREEMRNLLSLLSKHFHLARALLHIVPSRDGTAMNMTEELGSSNIYAGV